MKKLAIGLALTFGLTVQGLAVQGANAQEKIGDFTDWSVYQFTEGGSQVCFMVSQPKDSKGKYTRRDEVFFLVTHRPSQNSKNVNSFIAGYNIKERSKVTVKVDAKPAVSMFTAGDSAWALDEDDTRLVDRMRAGNTMVVKGTSWRGTLTTDTFSLSGFTKAYRAMSQACKV